MWPPRFPKSYPKDCLLVDQRSVSKKPASRRKKCWCKCINTNWEMLHNGKVFRIKIWPCIFTFLLLRCFHLCFKFSYLKVKRKKKIFCGKHVAKPAERAVYYKAEDQDVSFSAVLCPPHGFVTTKHLWFMSKSLQTQNPSFFQPAKMKLKENFVYLQLLTSYPA